MKKRYTEVQFIGFLREADKGIALKELCRRHGFSEASFYLWRSKYGGMDVADVKRLKALEAENARLKKLLAESLLEIEVTREALRKNGNRPGASRAGAVDANARTDGTTKPGDRGHERKLAAVSAEAGPERGSTGSHSGSGAAPSAIWGWDDPPEAPAGWRDRQLQAR